jgi:hypothetical protein
MRGKGRTYFKETQEEAHAALEQGVSGEEGILDKTGNGHLVRVWRGRHEHG